VHVEPILNKVLLVVVAPKAYA